MSSKTQHSVAALAWLAIFLAVFLWSAIHPKDRLTWVLEVLPAVIGFGAVIWCYLRFP